MNPWILAARPRTLGAAIIPVLAGSALAISVSAFDPLVSALILACAVLIQIATNFFNDAIDHVKGADTAGRLGPIRVTSTGLLPARQVMTGAVLIIALAALLAIPLVLRGGGIILLIGILSLFFAYAYTGGPLPLAYLGLGEIFVILFFGLIAVAGTFYLNTPPSLSPQFWLDCRSDCTRACCSRSIISATSRPTAQRTRKLWLPGADSLLPAAKTPR